MGQIYTILFVTNLWTGVAVKELCELLTGCQVSRSVTSQSEHVRVYLTLPQETLHHVDLTQLYRPVEGRHTRLVLNVTVTGGRNICPKHPNIAFSDPV